VPRVGEETPDLERFLIAHHRTDADLILDSKAQPRVGAAGDEAVLTDGGTSGSSAQAGGARS
jgi:hypothetical protein